MKYPGWKEFMRYVDMQVVKSRDESATGSCTPHRHGSSQLAEEHFSWDCPLKADKGQMTEPGRSKDE
jgi:hypothetical protein